MARVGKVSHGEEEGQGQEGSDQGDAPASDAPGPTPVRPRRWRFIHHQALVVQHPSLPNRVYNPGDVVSLPPDVVPPSQFFTERKEA